MAKELLDKLPNVIERKNLEASLDAARSILEDVVKKAVVITLKYGKSANLKFESKEAVGAEKELKSIYPGSAANAVERLGKMNDEVLRNLDTVQKLVNRELPNTLAKSAITYRQAAVIKLVLDTTLFSDYTTAMITYISTAETAHAYKVPLKSLVNQYTVDYVREQWPSYMDACTDLIRNGSKLDQKVRNALDIVIEQSDIETVAQTHGAEATVPFTFGFISTKYNFIKTWLSKRAEDRAAKYHLASEQLNLYETQMKLLEGVRSRQGTLEPALMKRVEELTSLIEVTRHDMGELERYYD